jgi:CheY-like chemotaxis protein
MYSILIVDDVQEIRQILSQWLVAEGYSSRGFRAVWL